MTVEAVCVWITLVSISVPLLGMEHGTAPESVFTVTSVNIY